MKHNDHRITHLQDCHNSLHSSLSDNDQPEVRLRLCFHKYLDIRFTFAAQVTSSCRPPGLMPAEVRGRPPLSLTWTQSTFLLVPPCSHTFCETWRVRERITLFCLQYWRYWTFRKTHRVRWQSHQGQALGKRLLADSSSGFTRWLMGLGRDRVKQVIALITGHGHFRKHLNTLGLRNEDSECRLCNKSEETAKHIILDCGETGSKEKGSFR
ncbi:hypothetical protein J6590_044345 [Homalodisca vitripennis]|nr:hypothetical protein J6590_044345 [Homalodisca vitripennis]